MAKEIAKMREIRIDQRELRVSLKNREEKNKELRQRITPIWTLEKEKRTEELNKLTASLVEGRKKVRDYQSMLKNIKGQLKETNRAYDLSKGE